MTATISRLLCSFVSFVIQGLRLAQAHENRFFDLVVKGFSFSPESALICEICGKWVLVFPDHARSPGSPTRAVFACWGGINRSLHLLRFLRSSAFQSFLVLICVHL